MLDEALAGDCIFAVGRVRRGETGEEDGVCEIGTAGLVRASREGDDGTSQLLLHGVLRVRFKGWLNEKPYPYALIEPFPSEELGEKMGVAAMRTLRGTVEDASAHLPEEVQAAVTGMLEQATDAGLMANMVAQHFVHDPDLRQRLLETGSVGEQISMLCGFFQGLGE